MAEIIAPVVADCSVVVKWHIAGEPCAAEAEEMLLDWKANAVEVLAPDLLPAEIMSAFLRAVRRARATDTEAREAIEALLALPFVLFDAASIALRAFDIAMQHNQRSYGCFYVAVAEQQGADLWTGDERLYNALHGSLSFVRWIGDYERQRP